MFIFHKSMVKCGQRHHTTRALNVTKGPQSKSQLVYKTYDSNSQKGPPELLEKSAMALPKTRLMMAVSFMTIFSAGPEGSLSGSPTVSPVTEFLCASEPFTYSLPR